MSRVKMPNLHPNINLAGLTKKSHDLAIIKILRRTSRRCGSGKGRTTRTGDGELGGREGGTINMAKEIKTKKNNLDCSELFFVVDLVQLDIHLSKKIRGMSGMGSH